MNPILRNMSYLTAINMLEKILVETDDSDEQKFLNRVIRELHKQKGNNG